MSKSHTTTAAKVTAEVSVYHKDPVSIITVRQELHKSNIHGTAATAKPPFTESKTKSEKDDVVIIKPGHLTI
jgi:hypothetical protein